MKQRQQKQMLWTTVLSIGLFVLMLVVALALKLFTIGDVPFQFYAALIGAAITVVITNLLLNSQTASEFEKQKMSKVYEEKLHIYQDYIKLICGILEKRIITDEDFSALQYQSSLVAMHAPSFVYGDVIEKTGVLLSHGCSEDDTDSTGLTKLLLDIVLCFHRDLYNKDMDCTSSLEHKDLRDLISTATTYTARGSIEHHPNSTIAQENFSWRKSLDKWSSLGWKKDEDNHDKDCLRLYRQVCGSDSHHESNVYVEILFDLSLGHYIIRAKSNPISATLIQKKYGGYRAKDLWWKVLESPIYDYKKLTLLQNFDNNKEIKELVANWFDDLLKVISVN